MHSPLSRFLPASLPSAAVALAAGWALAALAAALVEPAAREETAYLALWVTAVLLPAGLAAPESAFSIALAGIGVTVAAWLLPTGPHRGAAVGALLLAGVAGVAAQTFARARAANPAAPDLRALPAALTGPEVAELSGASCLLPTLILRPHTLPLLALALAALFGADRLLVPDLLSLLLGAAAPALLAGFAATSLAAARGSAALLAAGAAVLAGGGPGWLAATALAALAVGEAAASGRLRLPLAAPLLVAAALPLRDEPLCALAVLACGVAAAYRTPAVRLALAGVLLGALALRPTEQPVASVALLLVLAPVAFLPASGGAMPRVFREWLPGLALVASAAAAGGASALPVAAALALLEAARLAAREDRCTWRLQTGWTASLLAAAALVAGFPWLRAEPLTSALALWKIPSGLDGRQALPVLLLALAGVGAWLAGRARRAQIDRPALLGLLGLAPLALLLLFAGALRGELLLEHGAVVLSNERPSWSVRLPLDAAGALVLDATLSNSLSLPRGAPVATVRLELAGGRSLEWPLRSGVEVDEWAARRGDVAAALGETPAAWLSWVGPGGGFFAQRYRTRIELPGQAVTAVEVRLVEELPAGVTLALHHLEVRR